MALVLADRSKCIIDQAEEHLQVFHIACCPLESRVRVEVCEVCVRYTMLAKSFILSLEYVPGHLGSIDWFMMGQ